MNADPAIDDVILNTDLRHINFFNGRLLTGGDLEAEQSAQHTHTRHLGEAVGDGVAFGFEVKAATSSPPNDHLVSISAGLAVNRAGQTLRLASSQCVTLVRPPDPTSRDACVFSDCATSASNSGVPRGAGFYLLTVAPASQTEGKVPVSGLGSGAATCNSRYFTEGLKFRLLSLDVDGGSDPNLVRNNIAYACFGLSTSAVQDFFLNLTPAPADARALLTALVPGDQFTDYDVPLAVIEWKNSGGLGFIDRWAVRRRLTRRAATSWPFLVDDPFRSEAEARFLQFQDHLADLQTQGGVRAVDRFKFLPAAGLVPIANRAHPNVAIDSFFDDLNPVIKQPIDGAELRALFQQTIELPAIALDSDPLVVVYPVIQNHDAATDESAANPPENVFVFLLRPSRERYFAMQGLESRQMEEMKNQVEQARERGTPV